MIYSAKTDIGPVRNENQDSILVKNLDSDTILAMVCDGMGGHSYGKQASQLAVDVISKRISDNYRSSQDANSIRNMLLTSVTAANTIVFEKSKSLDDSMIMGTTCTLAVIRENIACIVNVGDSRAYHITDNIYQITKDHTYKTKLIEEGQISENDDVPEDKKNMITRAVGAEKDISIDYFEIDLEKGDKIFLCSDGVCGYCSDNMIYNIITSADLDIATNELLILAMKNGCTDNLSAALIEI